MFVIIVGELMSEVRAASSCCGSTYASTLESRVQGLNRQSLQPSPSYEMYFGSFSAHCKACQYRWEQLSDTVEES